MAIRYENRRTVATLSGLVRLRLKVRRCENAGCICHHRPYRPEGEAAIALAQHEFGLDVIALVGSLRYREHRSVPEIHRALLARGVAVCERTVTNLLDRGACPRAGEAGPGGRAGHDGGGRAAARRLGRPAADRAGD
jgi:hypothetical protein